MDALILQVGRDIGVFASTRGDAGTGKLVAGPSLELPPTFTAANREAWLEILGPVREFVEGQRLRPGQVYFVPQECELEVLSLPRVPRLSAAEALISNLRFQRPALLEAHDLTWAEVPALPSATPTARTYAVVSTHLSLSRRLREIPAALGCREAQVHVVPYPLAVARGLARTWPEAVTSGAILDVNRKESLLVLVWGQVPILYTRFPTGVESFLNVLCTKVALADSAPQALEPGEAQALLSQLDFGDLANRVRWERAASTRQVLQGLSILVDNLGNEVARTLGRGHDSWEVSANAGLVRGCVPLTGLDALLRARVQPCEWRPFAPEKLTGLSWDAGSGAGVESVPPLSVVALEKQWDGPVEWRDVVHRISTGTKWFATSQFCVLGLLVFLVGVMVGYGIDLRLARAGHRRNLVQSERESVEASRSLAELDRARLEATARLQALTQAKTGDTAARGLALDLGRYHWRGLCLDEVFVELAPPEAGTEKPNPYATLAGRAATPEAELQDFIVYLARLPMVAQAVLESVEKNPEPGLSCTFQIRLRLKE